MDVEKRATGKLCLHILIEKDKKEKGGNDQKNQWGCGGCVSLGQSTSTSSGGGEQGSRRTKKNANPGRGTLSETGAESYDLPPTQGTLKGTRNFAGLEKKSGWK